MKRYPCAAMFVALLTLCSTAQAQLECVRFRGTLQSSSGNDSAILGTQIDVFFSYDLSDEPESSQRQDSPFSMGEVASWQNGSLAISARTDGGMLFAPSLENTLSFFVASIWDFPVFGSSSVELGGLSYSGQDLASQTSLRVSLSNLSLGTNSDGNGIAELSDWINMNPSQPMLVRYQDSAAGTFASGRFFVDTIELIPTTIIIDGIDTGVPNLIYNGLHVSVLLEDCALDAKNHGQFVSCVTQLMNDIFKDELITEDERALVVAVAAQSSIGH